MTTFFTTLDLDSIIGIVMVYCLLVDSADVTSTSDDAVKFSNFTSCFETKMLDEDTPIIDSRGTNASRVLDVLLSNYDHHLRPTCNGEATSVVIRPLILSAAPVSDMNSAFRVDLYLIQGWIDERLQFRGPEQLFAVDMAVLDNIWKPDTYFMNAISTHIHQVTRPNKQLLLSSNGSVFYTLKITAILRCPMKFYNFPLDEQVCSFFIRSYSYNASEIIYRWWSTGNGSTPYRILPSIVYSEFETIERSTRELNKSHKLGNFSVLRMDFRLRRRVGYFYLQFYLPCILIVILSWVSFWINREATGDRVSLGITTVLTLSTFIMDGRGEFPEVYYATALDVFFLICFAFVVAAMLEFTGVHYFTKFGSGDLSEECYESGDEFDDDSDRETEGEETPKERNGKATLEMSKVGNLLHRPLSSKSKTKERENDGVKQLPPMSSGTVHHDDFQVQHSDSFWIKCLCCLLGSRKFKSHMRRGAKGPNSMSKIDKVSRVLFPVTFVIIMIIYWRIYAVDHDEVEDWIDDT